MAKTISQLTVALNGGNLQMYRPENAEFLAGTRSYPLLEGLWAGWPPIARLLTVVGTIALIAGLGWLAYNVLRSPLLTVKIFDATFDNIDQGNVYYHYVVDGTRYDKIEPLAPGKGSSFAGWTAGQNIVITRSRLIPSISWLDNNGLIQGTDLAVIAVVFGLSALFCSRVLILKPYRRMSALSDSATHILEGEITQRYTPGKTTVYNYTITSPVSGDQIRGHFAMGNLNPGRHKIVLGSRVAVLYSDDSLHTAL